MKRHLFISFIYFSLSVSGFAQIRGIVLDAVSKKPIEGALIRTNEGTKWEISSEDGGFQLDIKHFPAEIRVKQLGYKADQRVLKNPDEELKILLEEDNLRLSEVTVVAQKKSQGIGSEIVLGKQAIKLTQAQSLADVLQLLPGENITDSNLRERQNLNLRSAIFSPNPGPSTGNMPGNGPTDGVSGPPNNDFLNNNSFGVGYVIDDIPLTSNNGLTGSRGTANGLFSNVTQFNSVGLGLDLRTVSLDNIESIEVVQGISSAKYGDHSTGLVKINKAIGVAPLALNAGMREGSYNLRLTKGFKVSEKLGVANIGLDYLHSNDDPRNSIDQFDRVNASLQWQYKKRSFKNRWSVSYSQNISQRNAEEGSATARERELEAYGIRLTNNANWNFKDRFLNRVDWKVSLNYDHRNTIAAQTVNNSGNPIANSLEEGLFEIGFAPPNYRAVEEVNDQPFNFFSQFDIYKTIQQGKSKWNLISGVSIAVDDNFGKGTIVNPENPQQFATLGMGSQIGWRSINFNDLIPSDVKLSGYVTAGLDSKLFQKKLNASLGLRYDNFNSQSALSPRFNSALIWNKHFKTRLGFGYFAKAPSLQALYGGGLTYYDYVLANFRTNEFAFAQAYTFVRNFENPNLKPSQTKKVELGFDYNNRFLRSNMTFYYDQQSDGFTTRDSFEIANVPELEYTQFPNRAPDFRQVGETPVLLQFNETVNGLTSENYGVEWLINTQKVKAINTSFSLSAAYRRTKTSSAIETPIFNINDADPIWIGLHKPSKTTYKTFNSSVGVVHHVSKAGLVVSVTAEQFWIASTEVELDSNNPFAYYDRNLQYFNIPVTEQSSQTFANVRIPGNTANGIVNELPRIYTNYHLKVAKEFKSGFELSFYAVNFLNHTPTSTIVDESGAIVQRRFNAPISFGGTINYKF